MCGARVTARLLLLAALPTLAGRGWWCADGEVVSVTGAGVGAGPEFLPTEMAVVAAVGQDAVLDCRVRNLHDKAVSWVRSRDLHILSHAGAVFTADTRVSVRVTAAGAGAGAGATKHSLRIRRLRVSDAGRYECQLNTDPKMSLFYNLTVVDEPVPVGVIAASARDVHGAVGGAVTLLCEARYEPPPRALPLPPLDIVWRKDGVPVDLQLSRGGVSRDTERWVSRAVSRLTLAELVHSDAGVYECALPDTVTTATSGQDPAAATALDYIHLHVDSDSQMEAMQRDQSVDSGARASYHISASLSVTCLAFALMYILV
ncbi:unnamed protein product [Diatraea saccharalis]|uniref:Ig-like domain-containing protein n=1 Tax=Diatraea saccharalis TaxID=40085 RepID=A0A9N9R7L1_9NEOP|nr:unnamed protein product [Diatraea saccharalis]